MSCSPRLSVAAASAFLLLTAGGLSAQIANQGNDNSLTALAFADARFKPASAIVPIEEAAQTLVVGDLQARWADFQAASPVRWQAYVDRRTGHLESAVGGGIAWIPGSGNSLQGPEARLETLEAKARASLQKIAPLLGVDADSLALNPGRSGRQSDSLWYVDFDVRRAGMTIEGARVVFRVGHGNLIEIGGENLPSPAAAVPRAAVSREQALAALSEYVHGLGAGDTLSDAGSLHLLPANLAAPQFADGFEPGNGRGLALVWEIVFRRRGATATWRARVDAESGRVLELLDLNSYGRVTGGVYPRSPATTPETELGMPFDLVIPTNAVGFTEAYTDSNGFFALPDIELYEAALDGKYVDVVDVHCGPETLKYSDWDGNIRFGTSAGTDCDTPSAPSRPRTEGNGNTHASRTQFYHLNLIKEVGRSWLPSNTWLQGILGVNVNTDITIDGVKQLCQAEWAPADGKLNFTSSGGGCANIGEIADISYHEYGHGLDQNDGSGASPDKGTGETYGDFTAALMTHDSCIGRGLRPTNCPLDGYPCTACTGSRDIDYAKHLPATPATVANFTQPNCHVVQPPYPGPCGMEGHCESHVSSEALWDFVARDLPHPGSPAAWNLAERLWYLTRATATSAFTCNTNTAPAPWTSSGCATGSLWRTLRAADDDDGDLTNGTPHSCQLFAAFDRHGIACATDPGATVCFAITAFPAAPMLGLSTPLPGQIQVSWTSSAASAGDSASPAGVLYDVYRSDLGCGSGFVRIAENLSTSPYIDTAVAAGVTYSYQVVAHLAGCSACASAPSSCQSATVAQPACSLPAPTGLAVTDISISTIGLSWTAAVGAQGYNIYRATSLAGPYTLVDFLFESGFREYGDIRLGGNSTYFYKIRSFNNACESADSNIVTATTAICKPVSLYKSDFETGSGLVGWTALNFVAGGTTVDWRGIQSCSPARSGSQIFRFGGSTCGSTYGNNVAALAAPPAVAVPAGAGTTQLSFWHRRDFEANYDGGLLSVAFDGQTTFHVVHDWDLSGENYDNAIAPPTDRLGGGNCPLGEFGGYRVFSGTKSTLSQTVAILDGNCDDFLNSQGLRVGCGGHTIQPGFFAVSDCVQGGAGWFLDDVAVTTCVPLSAMDFYTITPCRLIDTRRAAGPLGGPSLPAGALRTFTVSGACGLPASAQSLSINLTVVAPGTAGYLQVYPGGSSTPVVSSINFAPGQTRANNGLITLSLDGTGTINVKSGTAGPVDFVIDVNGYYQ